MAKIEVDEDLCKGCRLCEIYCPQDVFERSDELNKKGIFPPVPVNEEKCVECRLCELICPEFAISVTVEEKDKENENEEDTHGSGKDKRRIRAQSAV